MKRALVVSILLNVIFAGWILILRAPQAQPPPSTTKSLTAPQRVARTLERKKPVPVSTGNAPANAKPLDWHQVESEDYQQYMANLRAIGCPEKTIRDIIVADINDLFEAHRTAILSTNYQFWNQQPLANREERTKQIWSLYLKKRDVLKSLGLDSPSFSDLVWQFYREGADQNEMHLAFLPESQRERVRQFFFEEESREMLRNKIGGGGSIPTQKEISDQVKQLLTPEEFKEYELRSSADADMIRRQFEGAQVTEAEYRTIFDWVRNLEELSTQIAFNSEEYRQAALATNAAIQAFLGPERFQRTVAGGQTPSGN